MPLHRGFRCAVMSAVMSAVISAVISAVMSASAGAQAGTWEGIVGGQRVTIWLDSAATGWQGRIFAPSYGRDTLTAASVTRTGDTVALQMPAQGQNALIRGTVSADRQRFGGIVTIGRDTVGLFRLGRTGSPAAQQILAQLVRQSSGGGRKSYSHPDSARLITSDVVAFWSIVDRAPPDSLEAWLERDYIGKGSPGLRDFIPGRIISAADLASQFRRRRAAYDSARPGTLRIAEAEPGIRAAYRKLKELYPETVYPDVYFIIGRFNSGGTASDNGLLIGAEMYRDPASLPGIVAHELIHFVQAPQPDRTLLAQSFREGAPNFVGEMIAGTHINNEAHRYGLAHERELWTEFKERMAGTNYAGWLYGDPPGERPADLGYFIGYRIAQAYYARAADKKAALRDIIRGSDVERIVAESGYNP